jgi:hypothetical protein
MATKPTAKKPSKPTTPSAAKATKTAKASPALTPKPATKPSTKPSTAKVARRTTPSTAKLARQAARLERAARHDNPGTGRVSRGASAEIMRSDGPLAEKERQILADAKQQMQAPESQQAFHVAKQQVAAQQANADPGQPKPLATGPAGPRVLWGKAPREDAPVPAGNWRDSSLRASLATVFPSHFADDKRRTNRQMGADQTLDRGRQLANLPAEPSAVAAATDQIGRAHV